MSHFKCRCCNSVYKLIRQMFILKTHKKQWKVIKEMERYSEWYTAIIICGFSSCLNHNHNHKSTKPTKDRSPWSHFSSGLLLLFNGDAFTIRFSVFCCSFCLPLDSKVSLLSVALEKCPLKFLTFDIHMLVMEICSNCGVISLFYSPGLASYQYLEIFWLIGFSSDHSFEWSVLPP